MLNICPSCSAENRDIARYCDQCGAPISADAAPRPSQAAAATASAETGSATSQATSSTPSRRRSGINWTGLVLLGVLLGVGAFVLFPSRKEQAGGPMMQGGADGTAVMGEVLKQVDELKKRIEADPADSAALNEIYMLYAQVGKLDQARQYLQLALDGIEERLKKGEYDADKAVGLTADVAQAAVLSGDAEGAMLALEFFHSLKPDDLRVLPFLGNLAYDLGRTDDAIKWYTQFLEAAEPEKFEEYWGVRVDRATMYLQKNDDTGAMDWVDKAQTELELVTRDHPEMFNAWFNLGQVYLHRKDKAKGREMFAKALTLAADDIEKFKAEREIALIDGKEPPQMPNPHGEGGSLEDMGLGPARPGVENPHGEGFSGADMANPHGEAGN